MNSGSDQLSGFVRDLGDAARNNPISAALIGMGAVWLFAGRSQRGAEIIRRSGVDRLPDTMRDAWEGTTSRVRSGAQNLRETASDVTDTVRRGSDQAMERVSETGTRLARTASDYVDDLPDRAGSLLEDAKESLTELFEAQPLAIGVVGLAVGAAIAAAFPPTEAEADYLGESSEFFKRKASEIAGEQVERAAEIGQKVAGAVMDEARQQGLTQEGLKSAAAEFSDKAARVADAARRSPS